LTVIVMALQDARRTFPGVQMDRKMAEEIVALVNGCIDQLIASLGPVEAGLSPDEFAAYKRGIARVITTFDVEIIDRVAREYPDLKPLEDDGDHPGTPDPDMTKASRN
jgi:hypothetical protein